MSSCIARVGVWGFKLFRAAGNTETGFSDIISIAFIRWPIKTKSSLVSKGPLALDSTGPMCCGLKEDTLFVLFRTGSTQKFVKRPDMTERVLTDSLTISADKKDISTIR